MYTTHAVRTIHLDKEGSSGNSPRSVPFGLRIARISTLSGLGSLERETSQRDTAGDKPFDTKSIFQHFYTAYKVQFDILEGSSFALEKGYKSLSDTLIK
jgi:hypothetical protein